MPDQPKKFDLDADIKAALAKKQGTPTTPSTKADESGTVPWTDIIRLLGATTARVTLPMAGQIGGALLPFPGAAEAGGGLGGGLGEAIAEQLEPGHPLLSPVKPNLGRVSVAAGLGAVPGSWITKAGRPLASAIRGGGLSYSGIAGNKIAEGTPVVDSINPLSKAWSDGDIGNIALGSVIGGGMGMIGGPKSPAPPPGPPALPVEAPLTPSGLRIAAANLAKRPVGAEVTPDIIAQHNAIASAVDRNPTGPLAQDIVGPKGVPPKPSINEMDTLHQQANELSSKLTPEQKRAYAESKTEQDMLLKAQKYADKVKADKVKAQMASGTEQSRALDKQVKANDDLGKAQGAAMDKNAAMDKKAENDLARDQGQAIEQNKKVDQKSGVDQARGIDAAAKRATLDQKATDAATQQAEIDARKTADGVVATASPVVESIKGVGPNGEPQSSRTTYAQPPADDVPPVDGQGNPVTPLAPHEQTYFSKGDALKAAKAANKAADESGQPRPYDPSNWNITEHPEGGARITQKMAKVAASPELTKALESEDAGTLPTTPPPPVTDASAASPNPNAAAIAELESQIQADPLLKANGGQGPAQPPDVAPMPPPAARGPLSLEQFNAVNSTPTQAPLPLEVPSEVPSEATPPPPPPPVAPEVPPAATAAPTDKAPVTDVPAAKGIGAEGQPIIPFKTPLEAAGSNYDAVLAAKKAGEAVPEEGRAAAGMAAGRIKSESPVSASEWDSMTDRQKQNFLTNIKRGLNSGTSPRAPQMDTIRPDITGPNGEMGPEMSVDDLDPATPPASKGGGGGTTLSAFGAGQGGNIMTAIRNNPMLAARLGLGTGGALIGAANDKDDPLKGAIVGGGIGAALPSAGRAIGNIDWSGLGKRLPDIERFGYLVPPNSMISNTVGAPIGLGVTTGIEKYLEGMFSGNAEERQKAVDLLKLLPSLPSRWRGAMAEAGQMLSDSPENIGEMHADTTGSGAKFWANRVLAWPAQMTTAAHVALRDAAIDAGYTKPQSTEFALGNDPGVGTGNRAIRRFGKGLSNAKATTLADDPPDAKNIMQMLASPFTRTATNVAAATPTRTPVLGALLKAAGQTDETWAAIAAQQGVGTAISGVAYLAGENTDPATASVLRKWVRNMGGRYGMIATVAFEMGQAAQQNKPKGAAFVKGVVSGVPMPTTEPFQDVLNAGTSIMGGTPQLPGAFIPAPIKDVIPKEYVTKRSR